MEVKAVSFTGKTPVKFNKKSYNEALARIIGQSNKDYVALTRKPASKQQINPAYFIKEARKFFANIFN